MPFHYSKSNLEKHNNAGTLSSETKTLHLIVYKDIIDKIFKGEKTTEYRIATEYWEKRIVGGWTKNGFTQKRYDLLRITNGYGNDTRPYILMKYPGYTREMKILNGDTIPTQHYAIPINRSLWLEYREEINGGVTKI